MGILNTFQIPGGIYVIHVVYHLLALTVDPADPNIRGGNSREKALFDRSQHSHVIENSHCYICQTEVYHFFSIFACQRY